MSAVRAAIRNASAGSTLPVPLAGKMRGGLFSAVGGAPVAASQALQSTAAVSTMFGIVNRMSTAVSQVEWQLKMHAGTGNEEDDPVITSHLALDVWAKPNDFMTRQEFMEQGQQHVDLVGEGWTVFGYTGKWPTSMWPVRPDRMKPVKSSTEYLTGYEYTAPSGEKMPLTRGEVMFIRMPNPDDPYRGLGPVQSLMADLDAMRYGALWNRNFFINSAEPGGVIEVVKNLEDHEFDNLVKRWDEQHRGISRANRVAILEGGAKWVANAVTQRDMQFVQLRTVGRDIVYEAYGMPKSVMGVTEHVNRANADAGEVTFQRWLTVPRLDRWKQALNNDFLPKFGDRRPLYFDYKSPIPGDHEADNTTLLAQAQAALFLNQCAAYDPADILEAVGLPMMQIKLPPPPPAPIVAPAPFVPDDSHQLDPKAALV